MLTEPETATAKKLVSDLAALSDKIESKNGRNDDNFWSRVTNSVQTINDDIANRRIRVADLDVRLAKAWENIKPFIFGLQSGSKEEPLLLFVWDEARSLVKAGIDGKVGTQESDTSKFRLLRRALSRIDYLNSTDPIRLFTLVTDTTSRIANFQPPLRLLDVSIDPDEVSTAKRLLHFGRSAWFSMCESRTHAAREFVALAVSKLTQTNTFEVTKRFHTKPLNETVKLTILALVGSRLAVQTGSYTTLIQELVASHMMVLLKVDSESEQLEAHCPSEPILHLCSSSHISFSLQSSSTKVSHLDSRRDMNE